jgi:hypothetical protein
MDPGLIPDSRDTALSEIKNPRAHDVPQSLKAPVMPPLLIYNTRHLNN